MFNIRPLRSVTYIDIFEREDIGYKFFDDDGNIVASGTLLGSEAVKLTSQYDTIYINNQGFWLKINNETENLEITQGGDSFRFKVDIAKKIVDDEQYDKSSSQIVDLQNAKKVKFSQLPSPAAWGVSQIAPLDSNNRTPVDAYRNILGGGISGDLLVSTVGDRFANDKIFVLNEDGTTTTNNLRLAGFYSPSESSTFRNQDMSQIYTRAVMKIEPPAACLDISKFLTRGNDYDTTYLASK